MAAPREEWHITVSHDNPSAVSNWHQWCLNHGVKPLYIELANYERQLMLASGSELSPRGDQTTLLGQVERSGWKVQRVKHEVQAQRDVLVAGALYYECHVKLDGDFLPDVSDLYLHGHTGTSRDLYRPNRWYVTQRSAEPFDPEEFERRVRTALAQELELRVQAGVRVGARLAGSEYEACLVDTNRQLDARWLL